MRTQDVQVGETYVVQVPHRLPADRYPMPRTDEGQSLAEWSEWWRLQLMSGGWFRMTVTALDTDSAPPMAEGLRVRQGAHVRIALTLEQALELGLPPGAYTVEGSLLDVNGDLVRLPDVSTMRVPTRWLHPADAPRTWSHRDLDGPEWA